MLSSDVQRNLAGLVRHARRHAAFDQKFHGGGVSGSRRDVH